MTTYKTIVIFIISTIVAISCNHSPVEISPPRFSTDEKTLNNRIKELTSSAIVVFTSVKYNRANQKKNEIKIEVFRVYDIRETQAELYDLSEKTATIVARNLKYPDSSNNISVLFVGPNKDRSDTRAWTNYVTFNLQKLVKQRADKRRIVNG